ncbi:alpha/beta fold hydrolase [Rhizobium leguminosarum]|uniref:alpha/beta fold hydrolase n=1 Tax=Rhizobium leguminosarum TaxID=384 RepID=UPI003F9D58DA
MTSSTDHIYKGETIYDQPEKVQSKFTVADGYQTHYLESGSARNPPLVLVHGGNFQVGLGTDRWFPNMVPLGRKFHVFAADELGCGQTDAPRAIDDIGDVRVRADHVIAFIDALGLGPVNLVGQSQASWIVAYIALRRPDLVRDMVLVDTASLAVADGGMGNEHIESKFTASFLPGTMVNESIRPEKEPLREWISLMLADATVVPDAFLHRCVKLAETWMLIWDQPWRKFWADGGVRNRAQYIVDGVHLGDVVYKLPKPPLLVWGRNSVKTIDNGVNLYKRCPSGSQFHVFNHANHFLWIDQWSDFNDLVAWYLLRSKWH